MSLLVTLSAHTGSIFAIEYMPDGTIVTGATDRLAMVWDPKIPQKLVQFNPLNATIYAIRLVSQDQVVAIGGETNMIVFYRINGASTPTLVKSIASITPTGGFVYQLIIYNLMYNNVNSTILYGSCSFSTAISIDVTHVSNIVTLNKIAIENNSSFMFAIEKGGR